MIETVARTAPFDRDLLVAEIERLEDWPDSVEGLEPHFVLFVAADTSALPVDPISGFAEKLLRQGAAYLNAWGPHCERVHDVFDETIVGWEIEGRWPERDSAHVMTAWHAEDSLAEALEFAVFHAYPAEDYEETCRAVVAVSVGNPAWAQQIRELLADLDRLTDVADADGAAREEREREARPRGIRAAIARLIRRR